jgi:hypothetical protein
LKYSRIENPHVPRKTGDGEVLIHRTEDPDGDCFTFVHQGFEPRTEAAHVELVVAGRRRLPQIEIQYGC